MPSDQMPVQPQNSTLRPFHSTIRHCCSPPHGMCSCLVLDPCKTLGDGLESPAIRCRALPVCSESEPSAEPRNSTPCNRFRGCGPEPEGSSHAGWDNSRHWLHPGPPLRWAAAYSYATRGDQRFAHHCCWQPIDGRRVNEWLV